MKTAVFQKRDALKRKAMFWALLTFLPTFLLARTLTYYFGPEIFIYVAGIHIHHMFWGISLLAITGYLALEIQTPRYRPYIGALYGAGLALTFDEFGMWLHLNPDYYWVHDFYEPTVVVLFILLNAAFFADIWKDLLKRLLRMEE